MPNELRYLTRKDIAGIMEVTTMTVMNNERKLGLVRIKDSKPVKYNRAQALKVLAEKGYDVTGY